MNQEILHQVPVYEVLAPELFEKPFQIGRVLIVISGRVNGALHDGCQKGRCDVGRCRFPDYFPALLPGVLRAHALAARCLVVPVGIQQHVVADRRLGHEGGQQSHDAVVLLPHDVASGHSAVHHLRAVYNLPEPFGRRLVQCFALQSLVRLFRLACVPQRAPGDLVSHLGALHGSVLDLLFPPVVVLDNLAQPGVDVGVVESQVLPDRSPAVLQRFLLPLPVVHLQTFDEILLVQHGPGSGVGCRLQQRHSEVRPHGRDFVV